MAGAMRFTIVIRFTSLTGSEVTVPVTYSQTNLVRLDHRQELKNRRKATELPQTQLFCHIYVASLKCINTGD